MDKLRETHGPGLTTDLVVFGLRGEIKRLALLLNKVLSLEQQADTRANEGAETVRRQAAKLRAAETQLKEVEYSLEQRELELADRDEKLSELAALRCLPSESAASMTGEIAALRRQLDNARAQNNNLEATMKNLKTQLTVARFKMVRPSALRAAVSGGENTSALKEELQATKAELDRVRKLALADSHRLKKQQQRKDAQFEKLQRDYVELRKKTGVSAGGPDETEGRGVGRLRFPTDWGAGAAAGQVGGAPAPAARVPVPSAVDEEMEDDSDDSDLG